MGWALWSSPSKKGRAARWFALLQLYWITPTSLNLTSRPSSPSLRLCWFLRWPLLSMSRGRFDAIHTRLLGPWVGSRVGRRNYALGLLRGNQRNLLAPRLLIESESLLPSLLQGQLFRSPRFPLDDSRAVPIWAWGGSPCSLLSSGIGHSFRVRCSR